MAQASSRARIGTEVQRSPISVGEQADQEIDTGFLFLFWVGFCLFVCFLRNSIVNQWRSPKLEPRRIGYK